MTREIRREPRASALNDSSAISPDELDCLGRLTDEAEQLARRGEAAAGYVHLLEGLLRIERDSKLAARDELLRRYIQALDRYSAPYAWPDPLALPPLQGGVRLTA